MLQPLVPLSPFTGYYSRDGYKVDSPEYYARRIGSNPFLTLTYSDLLEADAINLAHRLSH